MKKYYLITLSMVTTTLLSASELTDIDRLNLKYMYEGAKEVEMLNRSMEAGMRQHNQVVQPISTETEEHIIDSTPIDSFQDLGDKFYLEKSIDGDKDTKVKVSIYGDMIRISIITVKEEEISTVHGTAKSSYTSNSVEELSIPIDADVKRMKKSYSNGILKITIPKVKK